MKTRRILASACIGLMAATAPAAALELGYWGEGGGWDIMVDPSLGDGCLIQALYQDDITVRIGLDRNSGGGYVTVFNYNWGDIQEGAAYPILIDLDGQEYHGEAIGLYLNDVPGADVLFDNPEFLWDIAAQQTMTLYNESGLVMAIDLTGTMVGLDGVLACQDEMG